MGDAFGAPMRGIAEPDALGRAAFAGLWLMLPVLLAADAARAQEKPETPPSAAQSQPLPGPESGFIGAVGRIIERSLTPITPKPERPVEAAAQPAETRLPEDPAPVVAAPPPVAAPPAPSSAAPAQAAPPPAPAVAQPAKPTNPLEIPRDLAKGAIDAVSKLPSSVGLPPVGLPSGVVTGRERCLVAANGAPDCLAATEALCKSKGFSAGNSLDIQTAERCKAHVWLGATAQPKDCTTESFVTRAVCR